MLSQNASLKRSVVATAAAAMFMMLTPTLSQATALNEMAAPPPSDLQESIGFMSLVQLPCAYSPALEGADGGYMKIFNPTAENIDRGRPVIYRLSATGEHFTVHLKSDAAPQRVTKVEHRHAESSGCEAWTYVREPARPGT